MNPSKINRQQILKKFNMAQYFDNNKDKQNEPLLQASDNPNIELDIDGEIYNKPREEKIPISILSKLPSITKYSKSCCEEYYHKILEVLKTDLPNFTSTKKINLCIFTISKEKNMNPILLFLLYKNTYLTFPEFDIPTNIQTGIDKKLDVIFSNYKTKPEYIGYKEYNNNIYIFYEYKEKYIVSEKRSDSEWWWTTITEIINYKKVINYDIDKKVSDILIEYPLLYSLFNKNNAVLPNGNVVFYGGHQNYISFISSLGLPKESPTSNLGPYYYFYSYRGAGRRAIWSQSRKSMNVNGKDITRNEFGVYDRGGLVRFVIFGNTPKFFLNREDDLEDDSEISGSLAKTSDFIKSTLKIRDVDGKWAINHDIAYIGSTYVNVDKSEHKPRRLMEQWAVRDYNQHIPLSFHYINTDEFAKIKDPEKAKNMPYEYENYDIE